VHTHDYEISRGPRNSSSHSHTPGCWAPPSPTLLLGEDASIWWHRPFWSSAAPCLQRSFGQRNDEGASQIKELESPSADEHRWVESTSHHGAKRGRSRTVQPAACLSHPRNSSAKWSIPADSKKLDWAHSPTESLPLKFAYLLLQSRTTRYKFVRPSRGPRLRLWCLPVPVPGDFCEIVRTVPWMLIGRIGARNATWSPENSPLRLVFPSTDPMLWCAWWCRE